MDEIRKAGRVPRIEILTHGFPDAGTAYAETSAINLIGRDNLTNGVRGRDSVL